MFQEVYLYTCIWKVKQSSMIAYLNIAKQQQVFEAPGTSLAKILPK